MGIAPTFFNPIQMHNMKKFKLVKDFLRNNCEFCDEITEIDGLDCFNMTCKKHRYLRNLFYTELMLSVYVFDFLYYTIRLRFIVNLILGVDDFLFKKSLTTKQSKHTNHKLY